jgi:hypothetical protein
VLEGDDIRGDGRLLLYGLFGLVVDDGFGFFHNTKV